MTITEISKKYYLKIHFKNMDPGIGMCRDNGHDIPNWKDPVNDLKKFHIRIFHIHLKDITGANRLGQFF